MVTFQGHQSLRGSLGDGVGGADEGGGEGAGGGGGPPPPHGGCCWLPPERTCPVAPQTVQLFVLVMEPSRLNCHWPALGIFGSSSVKDEPSAAMLTSNLAASPLEFTYWGL